MTDWHVREFNCRSCQCHVRWRAAATTATAAEADAAATARLCRFCEVRHFTAAKGKTQLAAVGKSRTVWLTFPPPPR